MEWNVRVSGARNPDVIEKISAVFESYWQSGDFVPYDADPVRRAIAAVAAPRTSATIISPVEVRLEPFQERLLELHRRVSAKRAITAICSSPPPAPARP